MKVPSEPTVCQIGLDYKAVLREAKTAGTHAGYKLCLDLLQNDKDPIAQALVSIIEEKTAGYEKPTSRLIQSMSDDYVAAIYNKSLFLAVYSVASLIGPSDHSPSSHAIRAILCALEPESELDDEELAELERMEKSPRPHVWN